MIAQGLIQETTEREKSPFANVIAEYKTHARRVTERRPRTGHGVTANVIRAVAYYLATADLLEKL